MPSTLHTNDRFPSNEDKVVEKKVMKKKFWISCPDFRRPQYSLFFYIVIITILFGAFVGSNVYFSDHYEVFGFFLVWSRGFAGGVIITVMFLTFFISFELITWIRKKWKGRWLHWIDHNL